MHKRLWNHLKTIDYTGQIGSFVQLRVIRALQELLVGAFFTIFIYRTTQSFGLTIIGLTLYYLGLALAYPLMIWLGARLSFFRSYQLSFVSQGVFYLGLALVFAHINQLILPMVFLAGFVNGMFHAANIVYETQGLENGQLKPLTWMLYGIKDILGTVVPVLTGLLIVTRGYKESFILAGLVSLLALTLPGGDRRMNIDKFSWREFRLMFKLKGFALYSFAAITMETIQMLREYAVILAPFLVLGESELNVGILVSVVSLITGISSILIRNSRRSLQLAYLGAVIFLPLNFALAYFWDATTLIIRSLISPIPSILYNPARSYYEIYNLQTLLGHHLREDGLEIIVYRELLLLIARFFAGLAFILVLSVDGDFVEVSRIIFGLFCWWPIFGIWAVSKLQSKLSLMKQQKDK